MTKERNDDSISNMTDISKESKGNKIKSDEKSKQSIHSKGTRTSKDNKSENDDSSMSSKETVMKQLRVISNMLENERKEREQEKKE